MKLVVFGATGRTGRELVAQGLAQGHDMRAFVRDASKLATRHDRLEVVQGSATNAVDVDRAVQGADVVLSTLGHVKGGPKDLMAVATGHILAAMNKHGVRRIIAMTGAGVLDPRDQPKAPDRIARFMLKTLQGELLRDSEAFTQMIEQSGLDWIIVRGPVLTEGPRTGQYRVGYVGKDSGIKISRADVADFMLKQVANPTYQCQKPVVTY